MKTVQYLFGIFLFFFVFMGGLFFYFQFEDEGQYDILSKKPKVAAKADTGRPLELTNIYNRTQEVSNEPSALFNDPAINQAWGLKKSDAGRAWAVTQGSRDIVVAVIDTGIDIKHEDISGNLWVNPGESGLVDSPECNKIKDAIKEKKCNKAMDGADNDNNGKVDDVNGWNFVSNNNKLTDNHGHGTHIAGIIGAQAGNGKGISGISPNVSLMVLKYYDPKVPSTDNLKNTVNAIKYAIEKGANIINYSGGSTDYSQEEFEGVRLAEKKGILFVAAAGNERSNSDQFHYYPADYKLKNIISVTAIDPGSEVLSTSNFGIETVHIAAPGQNILSTLPDNSYGNMTGTSQATAFVSGAAALVMAHKRNFTAEDVKKYILATGDVLSSLQFKTKTSRKLNLYKALTVLDQGLGATGVKAANSFNMKKDFQFDGSADPDDDSTPQSASGGKMLHFGKDLMQALEKNTQEKLNKGREKISIQKETP